MRLYLCLIIPIKCKPFTLLSFKKNLLANQSVLIIGLRVKTRKQHPADNQLKLLCCKDHVAPKDKAGFSVHMHPPPTPTHTSTHTSYRVKTHCIVLDAGHLVLLMPLTH